MKMNKTSDRSSKRRVSWSLDLFRGDPKDAPLGNLIGAAIAVTLGLVIAFCSQAAAHDHANANLDSWYQSLESPGGGPCCDGPGVDAMKLEDPDWDVTSDPANPYKVKLDGDWVMVPLDRVVKDPNRAGQAIVWPIYSNGKRIARCFIPGSGA